MSTTIYYFSGTGNSLFIAKKLNSLLPDSELVPVVKCIRENDFETKSENIGFVFPVHGVTIPIPIRIFLKNMDVKSARYFFTVATRGGSIFRGFPVINKALKRHGKSLDAGFIVNMVTNDPKLSFYRDVSREEFDSIQANALHKLESIKEIITNRGKYHDDDNSGVVFSKNRLLNSFLSHLIPFMTHFISPLVRKYFYADSKCTGCGKCEKICLSRKIKMKDKRPVWQKRVTCYLCYSCLNYCPAKAIQIHSKIWMKSYTTERGRYPHPYATSEEIAEQKQV
ncbi:MAG: EFR1 family ferrodoxin [Spirochaetales bacterium]|nr:EFR1 family ferrodoxin [Spirochaetales bacterium]